MKTVRETNTQNKTEARNKREEAWGVRGRRKVRKRNRKEGTDGRRSFCRQCHENIRH